jgi:hypothetical protein
MNYAKRTKQSPNSAGRENPSDAKKPGTRPGGDESAFSCAFKGYTTSKSCASRGNSYSLYSWAVPAIAVFVLAANISTAITGGVADTPSSGGSLRESILIELAAAEASTGSGVVVSEPVNRPVEQNLRSDSGKEGATYAANIRSQQHVMANEYGRATPTVKKFIDTVRGNPNVIITNICGSYGGSPVIEHNHCAAVDVPTRYLPDRVGAKNYFESLDMVCEVHLNYSGKIVDIMEEDTHLHCSDKFFLEQKRMVTTVDMDALARAVAWHETKDCTLGYGKEYNNCQGIKRGSIVPCDIGRNRMCIFSSKEESHEAFKKVWTIGYGGRMPTIADARVYSGNDRADIWIANVHAKYREYTK